MHVPHPNTLCWCTLHTPGVSATIVIRGTLRETLAKQDTEKLSWSINKPETFSGDGKTTLTKCIQCRSGSFQAWMLPPFPPTIVGQVGAFCSQPQVTRAQFHFVICSPIPLVWFWYQKINTKYWYNSLTPIAPPTCGLNISIAKSCVVFWKFHRWITNKKVIGHKAKIAKTFCFVFFASVRLKSAQCLRLLSQFSCFLFHIKSPFCICGIVRFVHGYRCILRASGKPGNRALRNERLFKQWCSITLCVKHTFIPI